MKDPEPTQSKRSPLRPPPEEVAQRARNSFGVAYLTLTGVTQSVALAVLVARVEATYEGYDLANWVLAATTFLFIVIIWNEYSILSVAYLWSPTVADALIPFALLALQAFLAHNVYPGERAWLFSMAALLAVGALAFAYGFFQARRNDRDNRDVLDAIGIHQHLTMASTGLGAVLALSAALLYDSASLDGARTTVAWAALALMVATLLRSIPYSKRVMAYGEGTLNDTEAR